MKNMKLGPDLFRSNELRAHIDGVFHMLVDTDSELNPSVPGQMKHLGADLYVPYNMQAFSIAVKEVPGLVIACIEVDYVPQLRDFVVSKFFLGVSENTTNEAKPFDIDGETMRRFPIERYKRRVIQNWILQDLGMNRTPRWWLWESAMRWSDPMRHVRGAGLLDLERTARIYVAARYGDRDAHEAVADAFGISKSTAGRWIKKARDMGYIDNISVRW
ncbi:hypothetical protein BW14_08530 [Bifidobacterium sp. UTBIF-68]|uniref:helix-turn-helix domain-containing protein n=1 Tax=Bifidobacterium sp. UTBIF-68 TaxID=1465262 RepID=UPI00112B9D81|nr:helix-turn-helix domain-containing protein [Bifidobacterium sp. UTBIF-68]TPF92575.1 hypothetical protein BW14_08530 [Bifidobacterium sp. UTBIF-68]